MLVFSNSENVEVIFHEGQTDYLLITFGSLGNFGPNGVPLADGVKFWGGSIAERHGISALGFMPKKRDWYCNPDMERAIEEVRPILSRYSSIVVYGSSMGGHGALKFSQALGATATVALAPQYSINPDEIGPEDGRYRFLFDPARHRSMALRSDQIIPSGAIVIYDPFCQPDRLNATRIQQAAAQVQLVPAYFTGHECVRLFANADLALRLLQLGLARDVTGLHQFITKLRRGAAVRVASLAEAVARKNPATARVIFDSTASRLDGGQRFMFYHNLGSIYLSKGNLAEAEEVLLLAKASIPNHPLLAVREQEIKAQKRVVTPP